MRPVVARVKPAVSRFLVPAPAPTAVRMAAVRLATVRQLVPGSGSPPAVAEQRRR
jgi:hypothetical protein